MTEHDPVRLFDLASGADERVRRCLDAGRDELPTDAQLASLAAKLGPLLGGPGGGSPPAPAGGAPAGGLAGAGGALAMKAFGVAAVAAALAGGGLWWRARGAGPGDRTIVASPAAPITGRHAAPEPPVVDVPSGVDPAELREPVPAKTAPAKVRATVAPSADAGAAEPPSAESDPNAELALIREAQDAVRGGGAARALTLAADHARRFPRGVLAQEREVVAIEALARLGRTAEARTRADAFRQRWPRSAFVRRIDVILGGQP